MDSLRVSSLEVRGQEQASWVQSRLPTDLLSFFLLKRRQIGAKARTQRLGLHATDPGSIPGIMYGASTTTRSDPECKVKEGRFPRD